MNRNTFPATFMSMPKTRTVVVPLGFLVAGLGLSGVSTSAQFRQPTAELTPTVEQQAIQPGQTVTLVLGVELPENIHVQSDKPRDPFVIPTLLTFTLPEGVTVEEITYPESTDFLLAGWEEPLAVFEHEFTIAVRLALDADVSPGDIVRAREPSIPGMRRQGLFRAGDRSRRMAYTRRTGGTSLVAHRTNFGW